MLFTVLRAEAPNSTTPPWPGQTLSFTEATVLGLVEGITEFLPISSTGHLILTSRLLGLDDETIQVDENGAIVWIRPPSEQDPGVPLTPKVVANAYLIVIQAGAIAAVILLYWRTLVGILTGLLGKNTQGLKLLRNLAIATFPGAFLGLLLGDWIEEHLFSVPAVLVALLAGAVLMMAADRWMRRRGMLREATNSDPVAEMAALSPARALLVGGMQCFAFWPGTSRSMMAIVGACFAGLRPARAAEFSFLLGLPMLTAAAVYKGVGTGPEMVAQFGLSSILWGCLVAAISAALAVRWLVGYLNRHGLFIFGVYRIGLAIVIIVILTLNRSEGEASPAGKARKADSHQISHGHNS